MLEPKSQEIPFRFGLDLTEDEEGSPNGALELTNYDFDRDGALVRRNGFTSIGMVNTTYSDYVGLVRAGNTVGLVRRGQVDPGVPGISRTRRPGDCTHDSFGTYWSGVRVQQVDSVLITSGGRTYLCIGITQMPEASGTELADATPVFEVVVKIIDVASGAVLMDESVSTNTYGVRVCRLDVLGTPRLGIFYLNASSSNALTFRSVTLGLNPSLSAATVLLAATDSTAPGNSTPIDVATNATFSLAYVAVADTAHVRILSVDGSGAISAQLANGATLADGPLTVIVLASGSVLVVSSDSSNAASTVRAYIFPSSLASLTSSKTIGTTAVTNRAVAAVENPGTNTVDVFIDETSGTFTHYTYSVAGASVSTVLASANTSLASKPWYVTVGSEYDLYVAVAATNGDATGYRSVLVVSPSSSGLRPVGQAAFDESGLAGSIYFRSTILPQITSDGTYYYLPIPVDLETGDANTVQVGDTRVRRVRVVRLDFSLTRSVPAASLGNMGFVASSFPLAFDGVSGGGAAFADAPSAPTLTSPNAGVLTGAYSYRVVYEQSDGRGNIQVSPPSPAVSATVTSKKITVTLTVAPHARLRAFYPVPSPSRAIRVKIYRTAAGASIYYLAHTYSAQVGGTVTVDDNVIDSTLALAETLYTNGGVLESEPAPPLRHICAHRDRLFGVRSDTPTTIAFTQELLPPSMPRWNSSLTFQVDNDGGEPTAVASLGDKLVIFQRDQICVVMGEGPDALASGAFSLPEIVARGVGVAPEDVGSVATTPMGVVFRHRSGLFLLSPSLGLEPIGAPIRPLLDGFYVSRARYLPSRSQLWVLLRSTSGTPQGSWFVFDFRYRRWIKWTFSALVDVLEVNGTVYGLSRSELYYLDTTTYQDLGSSLFTQIVGLPWFRGPDRAQELRLWKVHLAGRKVAGAQNDVNIALEVFTQDERKPKSSTTADNTLTWSGSTVAALTSNFMLSTRAVSQRCRAFRCRLTLTPQTLNATSAGLTLGALVYDFGALMGRGKQPSGNRPTIS